MKFDIGQKVWTLDRYNAVQVTITKIEGYKTIFGEEIVEYDFKEYLYGRTRKETEIFETKEELRKYAIENAIREAVNAILKFDNEND